MEGIESKVISTALFDPAGKANPPVPLLVTSRNGNLSAGGGTGAAAVDERPA